MVAPVVAVVAAPLTIPALTLPEIALVGTTVLTEVLPIAATILAKIARVFAALLAEFATVDFALTEILAIVATVVAQFAAILATFLTEVAAIFASFLAELLTRKLRVSAPVLAVLVYDCCRTSGTCLAAFDALRLAFGAKLLALLNRSRIRTTFGLTCLARRVRLAFGLSRLTCRGCLALRLASFARLLALLHLFGARAAIAAILRQRRGGDQGSRADQCHQ
jgi:hypothetical protein